MLVFADTYFYVALLNRHDAQHVAALRWATKERPQVVTTEFVLLEVANFFKQPKDRGRFTTFVDSIRDDVASLVVPCDSTWFQKGLALFAARHDKEWSLTDCISFVVMNEYQLTEALTNDRHFSQAGFNLLLE